MNVDRTLMSRDKEILTFRDVKSIEDVCKLHVFYSNDRVTLCNYAALIPPTKQAIRNVTLTV